MRHVPAVRALTLLAATSLALGALAACDDKTTEDGATSATATHQAPALPVPGQFDATHPTWPTLDNLPSFDATKAGASLNSDGTRMAYIKATDGTISISEIDLTTGKSKDYPDAPLDLTPKEAGAPVTVGYIGDTIAAVTVGTDKSGATKWQAVLYKASGGDPITVGGAADESALVTPGGLGGVSIPFITENTDSGASAKYTFIAADGTVTTTTRAELSTPRANTTTQGATPLADPVGFVGGQLIVGYTEQPPMSTGSYECQIGTFKTAPCLTGFAGDGWDSQDPGIAPEGADPRTGEAFAYNGQYVVGKWKSQDHRSSMFRVFEPGDPEHAAHGTWTCEGGDVGDQSRLVMSPDGQYLAAGDMVASKDGSEVVCPNPDDVDSPHITAVDSEGIAYLDMSVQMSSWTPGPAGATVDIASGERTALKEGVVVPQQVLVGKDGKEFGVFISNGAPSKGAMVVAGYPRK